MEDHVAAAADVETSEVDRRRVVESRQGYCCPDDSREVRSADSCVSMGLGVIPC